MTPLCLLTVRQGCVLNGAQSLTCTLHRDFQVLGLRECVEGVDDAMRDGDLKGAARHIHRFLSFDPETLQDRAAAVLDTGTSPIEHLEQQKVCVCVCVCVWNAVPVSLHLSY